MYKVKIKTFEGPFDLLFHLIEKNEIDIKDIPIASVFEQYMEYLNAMQEMDLDIATEFILMAATLLEIKSSMLLPKAQLEGKQLELDEADPREILVERLIEYKKYKVVANKLKSSNVYGFKFFREEPEIKYIDKSLLLKYSADDLKKAYIKILKRSNSDVIPIKYTKDQFTVEDKIKEFLKNLIVTPIMKFSEFVFNRHKVEKVVSFMALLELVKLNKVVAEQKKIFGDIIIKKLKR
ncbi:segregation and condensation protein A [Thermoanaerobacterium thermosaccharolyticum]|jgi:segregation and condensation protein A|uniref:Segregation and condensation protein A n=2 Tax=Thermoanaerobacterium thermosaccharolyticum TaxID=1517 RepID=D9TT89_THETC|nr:segregation/condensation protein A [Thermoanaerobacterium thermosaccharolyticum]ADL68855.1 chromosome segregation and condensation protein ScpA [Thermoanaerobacterium thermosaccharolyticum DSM 571]AST59104.1 segregation and condensation protein A [Thermoanaerobacterium thermosaccharolyticum]PHO06522.1 segregation and condensation protein A [Thermoanaerobacterium thermosaccharolyticum]TCW37223.1 condensin subunit ScpA [Thermohydrogenium kirishiense]